MKKQDNKKENSIKIFNKEILENKPYDEFIIEQYEKYLFICEDFYKRDRLTSSKHLLYWVTRAMCKEGIEEKSLIEFIKESTNDFTEQKTNAESSRIETNIDEINSQGKV